MKLNIINTCTLGFAFKNNYISMLNTDYIEILGVYKKLSDIELSDLIERKS